MKQDVNTVQKISTRTQTELCLGTPPTSSSGTQTELEETLPNSSKIDVEPPILAACLEHCPDLSELICEGKEPGYGETRGRPRLNESKSIYKERSSKRDVRDRLGPKVEKSGRGSGRDEFEARRESHNGKNRLGNEERSSYHSRSKYFGKQFLEICN